jgi:hypothetical protein
LAVFPDAHPVQIIQLLDTIDEHHPVQVVNLVVNLDGSEALKDPVERLPPLSRPATRR